MPQVLGELTARHTDLAAPKRKNTGVRSAYHAPAAVLTEAQDRLQSLLIEFGGSRLDRGVYFAYTC
jgi:hypothetical protein